ncbi:porin family protein [Chitinophaga tropicalis]|uniref:Outer membrane beta-barrel protein n=1 Tax=Chitinophaga tropicalis TaxID=2683588 RepID=A0A7K1U2C0_9BACT|nr:porin family protein [Chitinophaga tropicalis]MVT08450.1 outer membrane beta-barrel protein [Chitinophaga tropicalis]
MKKVALSIAALLVAGISFGQVRYGVVGGLNLSSITTKEKGESSETADLLAGVRAGITADLHLVNEFYIGTGLLFAGKGSNAKGSDKTKLTLSYLQVPVNFMYKPQLGSGHLVLGAGPYIAYGLKGKYKIDDGEVKGKLNAFKDEAGDGKLKRLDAGLGVVAGYELKSNLYVGIHSDLGLVNIADKKDFKIRNTSFGVSVGYKF